MFEETNWCKVWSNTTRYEAPSIIALRRRGIWFPCNTYPCSHQNIFMTSAEVLLFQLSVLFMSTINPPSDKLLKTWLVDVFICACMVAIYEVSRALFCIWKTDSIFRKHFNFFHIKPCFLTLHDFEPFSEKVFGLLRSVYVPTDIVMHNGKKRYNTQLFRIDNAVSSQPLDYIFFFTNNNIVMFIDLWRLFNVKLNK